MWRLLVGILCVLGLMAIWLHQGTNAVPNRTMPVFRPALTARVFNEFGLGKVVMVKVNDASRLTIWLGNELYGKRRSGDQAISVARSMDASVVMTASFHWWTGEGFIVLGQVVYNGENLVSPNPEVLRWQRCYFATTWDGKFLIGETNLTTGKLIQKLPQIRHLVGGGGWLIKDGDPEAWRLAFAQGFRQDITNLKRERTVVAIDKNGETAWLTVFEGCVSLQEAAWFLKRNLPIHHAIFFDGGRNSVLVIRSQNGEFLSYGTPRPLPEVPCMLVVR
jgi:hypothetical protein